MPSEFYRDSGGQGFLSWLSQWWKYNHSTHISRVHSVRLSQRSFMDGEVIKNTGEVIPKESV